MAPKSKGQRVELKQEDVLQAVIIADSFDLGFSPISKKKPRTLLPVANVPMLEYTLELLCAAEVQEIFIFCCHLGEQIRSHIRNSKWSDTSSPCSVSTVLSEGCLSMGEALREIDAKSIIRSDFILVFGDVVANVKLQDIVEQHKKRRRKDKNTVMTMVMKKAPPTHCTRCREDDIVMAVEQPSSRILHYQKLAYQTKVDIPVEVITEHSDVNLRYDLLDCHISICSPQVPQLFTDNFDFQTRDDFVKGILISEEIMGYAIYVNVIREEYAARISNLIMYDAVSQDIMSRWTYPLVPDHTNSTESTVSYGRHNIYLSKDITLARGCKLEENVVVGRGTSVGSNTVISHSVIGKNCKIGENVKIRGAYIWDNVEIGDNCDIESSILCDHVKVYSGVTLQAGDVLSWEVKVGPDVTIPKATVLQSSPEEDSDDFGDEDETLDKKDTMVESCPDFGSRGQAYVYSPPTESDDEEDEAQVHDVWGQDNKTDDEDELSSIATDDQSDLSSEGSLPDDEKMFYREVLDTLVRAREENIRTENLILEINSLKHAYNIDIHDLHGMVVKAVVDLGMKENPDEKGIQLLTNIKTHMKRNLTLIKNYIKGADSQLDCLQMLEEFSIMDEQISGVLMKLIHYMYEDIDLLSEQVIVRWHKSIPDEEGHLDVKQQMQPFIKWLQEAEEESSEEDSD
ncbi:translation initiation factor eIF-2B subunit epsilon-like [Mizuhopecten yessoensis]|uniref:Translation initiation factor eIF2B subunit epsilon n=1 Tax=Mizuhopecten yessoensis TaxID=6573 RepID=A0A210Q680_MIZYE|nr:translation initiation factor eIF-2B subunit epsilon-like [Mizuhopecten yessoensis]OWF44225.1 Translation initiation factor eIF-2B subunit epsilon [Mizuhopecten yessoensis]